MRLPKPKVVTPHLFRSNAECSDLFEVYSDTIPKERREMSHKYRDRVVSLVILMMMQDELCRYTDSVAMLVYQTIGGRELTCGQMARALGIDRITMAGILMYLCKSGRARQVLKGGVVFNNKGDVEKRIPGVWVVGGRRGSDAESEKVV